jgi:hypothetical protein
MCDQAHVPVLCWVIYCEQHQHGFKPEVLCVLATDTKLLDPKHDFKLSLQHADHSCCMLHADQHAALDRSSLTSLILRQHGSPIPHVVQLTIVVAISGNHDDIGCRQLRSPVVVKP